MLPIPQKSGYTFECWCTDPGLSNSVGTGGATYNATSSITLYAKWTQNPIITYTVTYNKNTEDLVGNMPTNQTKTQGVNLKLSDLVPTRAGYIFKGWSANISQTEAGEYQAGVTYSQDANLILYAVWKKAGASSIEVAQNVAAYYGQVIENYNIQYDESASIWRIFMADNENIYLISGDYIHYNYVPTKNGQAVYKNDMYRFSFNTIISQYTGSSNINSEIGNKLLSLYWNNGGLNSQSRNSKAVAYMLDTEIWNEKYKKGYDFIDYVIGGPTIEMYCKSYKDTHPGTYIECSNADSSGYKIRWNGGSDSTYIEGVVKDEFNKIYLKSSTSKANSMWLASPTYGGSDVLNACYDGTIKGSYDHADLSYPGFCPIVCLNAGVQLEKNKNTGTYKIIY